MINLLAEILPENQVGGGDIYFFVAIFSTVIFVSKFLMMILGGGADTPDAEVSLDDGGGDHDVHHDSSGSFTLISIQSVLAFLMGMGWIGYFAITNKGYSSGAALSAAFGAGVLLMVIQSFMLMQVKKLNHVPVFDLQKNCRHPRPCLSKSTR